MERVPIAHFADPSTADSAAAFLQSKGFDATSLDKTGNRSPAGGVVLVTKTEAVLALAWLRRASKGEFANGVSGWSDVDNDVAIELTRALRGSGDPRPSWLHALPIIVVGIVVVLWIVSTLVAAALQHL